MASVPVSSQGGFVAATDVLNEMISGGTATAVVASAGAGAGARLLQVL
jgi:hypothetical protein